MSVECDVDYRRVYVNNGSVSHTHLTNTKKVERRPNNRAGSSPALPQNKND